RGALEARVAERTRALEHAESMAREGERRLQALVDASLDGIVLLDSQRRLTAVNPAAEKLLACSPAEAMRKPLSEVLFARAAAGEDGDGGDDCRASLDQLGLGRLELSGKGSDGRKVILELSMTPLEGARRDAFAAFLRDQTE